MEIKHYIFNIFKYIFIAFIAIILIYILLLLIIVLVDKLGYEEKCIKFKDWEISCFDKRLMEKWLPE